MTRRRALPLILLGALTLLTTGAAVVGAHLATSSDQLALQAALNNTMQAPNFRFIVSGAFRDGLGLNRGVTVRGVGTWQTPDRMRLNVNARDGGKTALTVIGASVYEQRGHGSIARARLTPPLSYPFVIGDEATFSLPPIGDTTYATNIERHGDTYSFMTSRVLLNYGWVAYAPNSRHAYVPEGLIHLNVLTNVVVRNGFIVSISCPRGIPDGEQQEELSATWRLSDFGHAPRVVAPTAG
jgi:hypothetical protein